MQIFVLNRTLTTCDGVNSHVYWDTLYIRDIGLHYKGEKNSEFVAKTELNYLIIAILYIIVNNM